MDTFTIANIFSARTGYIYSYTKPTVGDDIGVEVTEKIADLMGKNNFISSVTRYNGMVYAYISEDFPESVNTDEFVLIGNVEQALKDYSDAQQETLRKLREEAESAAQEAAQQEQNQETNSEEQ
jgi:hypothetical protein